MDFARRMMTQQTAELKAERTGSPRVVYRMDAPEQVTPIQVKWNRLVIMQRIVHAHALTGPFTTSRISGWRKRTRPTKSM
eukprot:990994-Karenia_brevis.AAC.1